MNTQVLVAYATTHGATAEIAEKIGQVLRDAGLATEVLPASRAADAGAYKAVVLGSSVHIGRWRKEAATFLKANQGALAHLPVWLFSSGPTGEADIEELTKGWRFPKALQPVADHIQPRQIVVFRGAVDVAKLNAVEKWMIKKVDAPLGDFREWDVISSWAAAVAEALNKELAGS